MENRKVLIHVLHEWMERELMNKRVWMMLIAFVVALGSGCSPIYIDGWHRGKLLEAGTDKPIQGAVILGSWTYRTFGSHEFYDAKETVSDENGNFTIFGLGVRLFSAMDPMDVEIFKRGYEPLEYMSWEELNRDPRASSWGSRVVIRLKKLTTKKERGHAYPNTPSVPAEKQKLMLEEIKKNRYELYGN